MLNSNKLIKCPLHKNCTLYQYLSTSDRLGFTCCKSYYHMNKFINGYEFYMEVDYKYNILYWHINLPSKEIFISSSKENNYRIMNSFRQNNYLELEKYSSLQFFI